MLIKLFIAISFHTIVILIIIIIIIIIIVPPVLLIYPPGTLKDKDAVVRPYVFQSKAKFNYRACVLCRPILRSEVKTL